MRCERRRMINRRIPNDWIGLTIGDAADYINGRGFKPSEWEVKGLPIIRIQNLNNPKAPYNYTSEEFKQCYKIENGDLLFSWSASLGVYIWKEDEAWLNQHIFKVIPKEYVTKKYLYYSLQNTIAEFYNKTHGSGMVHITKKKFEATRFLLPPLPEQRAIVSKIEQFFSDLDNGIENFKKAQEQLKIYRQAVLKKAFEGELTKKWREEQADLPSAEELLQQIKEEREKHYQKQLDGWEQDLKEWEYEGNKGKKPTKPKKTKELFPLTEKELAVLLELPDGKFWLKLGMLTLNVEYGTSAKSKKEGKVPVLRMGNIQNNCFVWNDLVYTDDEDEINKYLLKKGDVLFNRTNSPELVGKTAIYNGEKTAIFAGYLIRINQIHSLVNPNYLNYFLNSYTAKVHGNTVKTDGVNQSNINGEKLKNYPFPYFSLLEQHQIVYEIETRFSICDKMEETIAESLKKAEALRQSILKKAFEGKLLNEKELEEARNAPEWEPAEKLLERIKAQKKN